MWLAVDKNKNKIPDFEATTGLNIFDYERFADRIKRKYKMNILCTDGNFVHQKIKISQKHIISKSETGLVEGKSSIIRKRFAKLHRRTSCYSKAVDMISDSLLLLPNETLLYSIIS